MDFAEYDCYISKTRFNEDGKPIAYWIHERDNGEIDQGQERERNWLIQKLQNNFSVCTIKRNANSGKWIFRSNVFLSSDGKGIRDLPKLQTKRKTFVSFYHKLDQDYRERFDNLFSDLVVAKSVKDGDIDSDNSDEYIKQLIQKEYLYDTTVLVVLLGSKTYCRKHVDWEVSGALNFKVGDHYAGLLLLKLPGYTGQLSERLQANVDSGYAILKNWTDDRVLLQQHIEDAFTNRKAMSGEHINKAIPQLQEDLCD